MKLNFLLFSCLLALTNVARANDNEVAAECSSPPTENWTYYSFKIIKQSNYYSEETFAHSLLGHSSFPIFVITMDQNAATANKADFFFSGEMQDGSRIFSSPKQSNASIGHTSLTLVITDKTAKENNGRAKFSITDPFLGNHLYDGPVHCDVKDL